MVAVLAVLAVLAVGAVVVVLAVGAVVVVLVEDWTASFESFVP